MSSSPSKMKALVARQWTKLNRLINYISGQSTGQGIAHVIQIPIPKPGPTQLLVEVRTVALNPTDFKHVDIISPADSIIGCDYAGVVKSVGKSSSRDWKVGDRIAGLVHGGLFPDRGSFAQFLKVDADLAWRIPDGVSDQDASTFGISAVTAMQGIYHNLDVPWPDARSESSAGKPLPTILIYAGSTAAGLFAIQLATLGGYQAVTTCSPHSNDLVEKYGATAAFDYNSPSAIQDIKDAFPDIKLAMDCISEGSSTSFCCSVLENNGGRVITLLDQGPSPTSGVEVTMILSYTLMGRPFQYLPPIGPKYPSIPGDRAALARFYALLPSLLMDDSHRLKAPPSQIMDGGFDALLPALDMLRKKQVSGKKLVVELKSASK